MRLKHLAAPESKLQKKKRGTYQKNIGAKWPKPEECEQQSTVLDYNPKEKINRHESILIQMNK